MAETYRGLTIKIGGDTTQLSNAIKGVNRDASNLEAILRKSTKALKLDPSSITATKIKMEALSDKTTELYGKYKILDSYQSKMKASDSFKEAATYVNKTGDSVGQATDRLNGFNKKLEEMKRGFAALDGVDLSKQSNFTKWDKDAQKNIASLRELGKITEEDYQKYRQLAEAQKQAQSELDMTKQVQEMRDLAAEIEKTHAQAKSLAKEYVELRTAQKSISNTTDMKDINTDMTQAKNATERLNAELEKVNKLEKQMPKGFVEAAYKADLLAEKSGAIAQELKGVKNKMKALEMKGIDKNLKDVQMGFQKARTELEKTTQELKEAEGKLKALNSEAKRFETQGMTGSSDYKKLTAEISKTEAKVKELSATQRSAEEAFDMSRAQQEYRELRSEANRLNAELAETNAAAKLSHGRFEGMASSFTNIGLSLATTVTPAMQMFMSSAVDSAQEIDGAYRNMRKTVNGTEEDFEALKQSALDFSKTHVTSADQILEIQAMGGQLGIAAEDLDTFSKVISNLNIATNISDAGEMAEKLGQLANITGMTREEYERFADALVRLGNNSPTLESNIMEISSRIGSMGSIIGMTVPEMLALSTAVASTGQQSEAAGTAISKTMSDIESAVSAGGDSLAAFAKVSGMSAKDFKSAWQGDPMTAIRAFVGGLKKIEDSGGSADGTLKKLKISSVRQKQALLGLTQTLDVLDSSLMMSKDAWNGVSDQWGDAGDAAREAQRKAEGFSGQMAIMQNNVQVLGSSMAESLAPILGQVNELFQQVTNAIDGLDESQKQAILGAAGFASALGPVLTFFGAVIPLITKFRRASILQKAAMAALTVETKKSVTIWGRFSTSVGKVPGVVGKAGRALSGLNGGLVALGVTLAALVIGTIITRFEEMRVKEEQAKKATDGLKASVEKLSAPYALAGGTIAAANSNIAKSYDEVVEQANKAREAQANLADTISQRQADTQAQISTLQQAKQTIETFANTTQLSAGDQQKLHAAIKYVNEACGTQYSVVDSLNGKIADETGAIIENTDAIADNINKIIEKTKIEAQQETLKDMYKQQATNYQNINDLVQKQNELQQRKNELEAQGANKAFNLSAEYQEYAKISGELAENNRLLGEARTNSDSLNKNINNLAENMGSFSESARTDLQNIVQSTSALYGETSRLNDPNLMNGFITSLSSAGISAQTFGDLNEEELANLAMNYDGSLQSISGILADFATRAGNEGLAATLNWVSGLKEGDAQAIEEITEKTGLGLDKLQQFANDCGLKGDDAILQLTNSLNSATPGSAMGNTMSAVALQLTNGNIEEAAKIVGDDTIKGFAQALVNGEPQAEEAAKGLGKGTETALKDYLQVHSPSRLTRGIGENTVAGFIQGLNSDGGQKGGIFGAAQSLVQKFIGGITGGSAGVESEGQSAVTSYKTGIERAPSAGITKAGQAKGKAAQTGFGKVKANTQGRGISTSYWQGISRAPSSGIRAAGKSKATAAKTGMGSVKANSTGRDFVAGFASGMGSFSLVGVATRVAKSAMNTIKSVLGIRSPSREMMKVGKYFSEGFAIGISQNAKLAASEAKSLADKSVKAMEASSTAASIVYDAQIQSNGAAFGGASQDITNTDLVYWLSRNLGDIISNNAPNLVIDNEAGQLIVDTRLNQLQQKAVMNRG